MQTRSNLNALFMLVLLGAAAAAEAQVQPELARRYFDEATKLCERDAGRLWGVSLCGPLVIVDLAMIRFSGRLPYVGMSSWSCLLSEF